MRVCPREKIMVALVAHYGAWDAARLLYGFAFELDQVGQHGAGFMINRMADDLPSLGARATCDQSASAK